MVLSKFIFYLLQDGCMYLYINTINVYIHIGETEKHRERGD